MRKIDDRRVVIAESFERIHHLSAYSQSVHTTADPNDLHSAMIFDSKPYPADGDVCSLVWANPTGHRILIRKSYLWAGMFKNGVADIDVQIERGDGSIVAKLQWDHYADPVGPVARDDYFTPYMALGAGESLTMTYRATSIVTPTMAHIQFVAWWTQD